jgi:hypothetical protein
MKKYTKEQLSEMNSYDLVNLAYKLQDKNKIEIELTEQELQELQNGQTQEWKFNGMKVKIHAEQDLPF